MKNIIVPREILIAGSERAANFAARDRCKHDFQSSEIDSSIMILNEPGAKVVDELRCPNCDMTGYAVEYEGKRLFFQADEVDVLV